MTRKYFRTVLPYFVFAALIAERAKASASLLIVTEGNQVISMSSAGTNVTPLAFQFGGDLATNGSTVYFQNDNSRLRISSIPSTGGTAATVFTGNNGGFTANGGLDVDSGTGNIYFATGGAIQRWDSSTNTISSIFNLGGAVSTIRDLAIDSDSGHIYFIGDGPTQDYVRRINLNGTGETPLLSFNNAFNPTQIELDLFNDRFYVTGGYQLNVELTRAKLDGSAAITLLNGTDSYSGIAVDGEAGDLFLGSGNAYGIFKGNLDAAGLTQIYVASPGTLRLDIASVPEPTGTLLLLGSGAMLLLRRCRAAAR